MSDSKNVGETPLLRGFGLPLGAPVEVEVFLEVGSADSRFTPGAGAGISRPVANETV